MWPSRKTLKNEVKLIDPIQQDDDEDIDWLALPIKKDDNLEGSIGLELQKHGAFLCTKIDRVLVYDSINFKHIGEIPIKLLKTETREPNEIIAL